MEGREARAETLHPEKSTLASFLTILTFDKAFVLEEEGEFVGHLSSAAEDMMDTSEPSVKNSGNIHITYIVINGKEVPERSEIMIADSTTSDTATFYTDGPEPPKLTCLDNTSRYTLPTSSLVSDSTDLKTVGSDHGVDVHTEKFPLSSYTKVITNNSSEN